MPKPCTYYKDGKHIGVPIRYKRNVHGEIKEGYELKCRCGLVIQAWRPGTP